MTPRLLTPLLCALHLLLSGCSPGVSEPNTTSGDGGWSLPTGGALVATGTTGGGQQAPFGVVSTSVTPLVSAPLDRTAEQELQLRSARNAVAMGNNSQAIELFQSYLSRTFGDHEAKMEYAGILVREGHLDSALRALEELREDQPGDAETRRRLADVLIMGGEYWSAIANLEEIAGELAAERAEIERLEAEAAR